MTSLHDFLFSGIKVWKVLDTNPTNRLTRPGIKTSPKNHLDSDSNGNLDPLLIKKQEPWYKYRRHNQLWAID